MINYGIVSIIHDEDTIDGVKKYQLLNISISFYNIKFEVVEKHRYKIKPIFPISNKFKVSTGFTEKDYESGITMYELNKKLSDLVCISLFDNDMIKLYTYGIDNYSTGNILHKIIQTNKGKSPCYILENIASKCISISKKFTRIVYFTNINGARLLSYNAIKLKDATKLININANPSKMYNPYYLNALTNEVFKYLENNGNHIYVDVGSSSMVHRYTDSLIKNVIMVFNNDNNIELKYRNFTNYLKESGWVINKEINTIRNKYTDESYCLITGDRLT